MKKEENIIKLLNEMLDKKMKDNPTRTIASLRNDIVYEAKEKGMIKDYHYTTNKKPNGIYFGSCAGFDRMYRIEL